MQGAGACQEQCPADVPALVDDARTDIARGEVLRGIDALDRAIRLDPESAEAHWLRGAAWLFLTAYDQALADIARADQIDAQQYETLMARGVAWHRNQRYDQAIADYTKAIRIYPRHYSGFLNRGAAWVAAGNDERAIADFDKAIRLNPDDAESYSRRADAWHRLEDYEKALADYDQALRIDPNRAKVYLWRGFARLAQGQNERAIDDFSAAIRLDPKQVDARRARGQARLHTGDFGGADTDLTLALEANPRVAELHEARGYAAVALKNYDQGIADFTAAIRLDPNKSSTYVNRGSARFSTKDFAGAIKDYTDAIRLGAHSADIYYGRGEAYTRLGELEGAIADFSEAIRLDPEYFDALLARGDAWNFKRDAAKAVADYREADRLEARDTSVAEKPSSAGTVVPAPEVSFDADSVVERIAFDPGAVLVMVPLKVGEREYLCMVDSGATRTIFDRSLPLEEPNDQIAMNTLTKRRVALQLVSPPVASLGRLQLSEMLSEVGGADLSQMRDASGYPIYGVIGMDLLKQLAWHIDFDRGEIVALNWAAPSLAKEVELSLTRHNMPLASVDLPSRNSQTLLLDTGFTGIGTLDESLVSELVASGQCSYTGRTNILATFGGWAISLEVQSKSIRLGDVVLKNPTFNAAAANILGLEGLRQFNVTFDFPRGRMYLQPRAKTQNVDTNRLTEMPMGEMVVDLAENKYRDRDFDREVARYSEIIRLHPSLPNAYRARGFAWGARHEYQKAIDDLDEAIRLKPDSAESYLSRATARRYLGDFDRAMADYHECRRLDLQLAVSAAENESFWTVGASFTKPTQGSEGRPVAVKPSGRPTRRGNRWFRR